MNKFKLGYFIQFSGSTKNKQNADFVTPIIKPTTTQTCFSFYYYAFGNVDNVSLALFSIQDSGIQERNDTWFKANSHNDKWHRTFITIPPQNKPFTVSQLSQLSQLQYKFIKLLIKLLN